MRTEHKQATLRIRPNPTTPTRHNQAYTGWYNASGNRIVCQGPRSKLLRELEPPGDYPKPSVEKPLWHTLKRWNALFDYDPVLLSKEDAVAYLRMRYFEDATASPDWHKTGDWVRAYLRGEGYRSIGKGHFLHEPPIKRFCDSGGDDGDGITSEEKLDWFAFSRSQPRSANLNYAKRHGETGQAEFFEAANKQPRDSDLSPEEQRELEERSQRDVKNDLDLEAQIRLWFLKGVLWTYLDRDPTLRKECQDIAETETWHERAERWGFATRGGAQKHAQNAMKRRLLTVSDGRAMKVLLELMEVLGVPTTIKDKYKNRYEGPYEVYKDNRLGKMETTAITAPYIITEENEGEKFPTCGQAGTEKG